MRQPRKSRRMKRRHGFSGQGQGQTWDFITQGADIRGKEKRHFFNNISRIMVLSAGVVGAYFGYSALGWTGMFTGFVVAVILTGKFVVRGLFYR